MKARDTAIEPRLCPTYRHLVLDGEAKLRLTTSLGMEIHTTILHEQFPIRSIYLGLIAKSVSLHRQMTLRHAPNAANSPEIFGELRYGIGHQLMQLRLELE
jgi:hypothetical protein